MIDDLTILVSSTDAYADCWDPFFTLFGRYFPGWRQPVLLNTDRADYQHASVEVVSTRFAADLPAGRRLPWGAATRRGLARVTTPFVLWLQEDYFLRAPVDADKLARLVALMRQQDIPHITLVRNPEHTSCPHPDLEAIAPNAAYRISLQAGLWRTDALAALPRDHESPWLFEIWGSRRERRRRRAFLCVGPAWDVGTDAMVYPYDPTGIVQGRWSERVVVDLFAREGIVMDFARRGFHRPGLPRPPRPTPWRWAWDRLRSAF